MLFKTILQNPFHIQLSSLNPILKKSKFKTPHFPEWVENPKKLQ